MQNSTSIPSPLQDHCNLDESCVRAVKRAKAHQEESRAPSRDNSKFHRSLTFTSNWLTRVLLVILALYVSCSESHANALSQAAKGYKTIKKIAKTIRGETTVHVSAQPVFWIEAVTIEYGQGCSKTIKKKSLNPIFMVNYPERKTFTKECSSGTWALTSSSFKDFIVPATERRNHNCSAQGTSTTILSTFTMGAWITGTTTTGLFPPAPDPIYTAKLETSSTALARDCNGRGPNAWNYITRADVITAGGISTATFTAINRNYAQPVTVSLEDH
jgi:hypothetical protein